MGAPTIDSSIDKFSKLASTLFKVISYCQIWIHSKQLFVTTSHIYVLVIWSYIHVNIFRISTLSIFCPPFNSSDQVPFKNFAKIKLLRNGHIKFPTNSKILQLHVLKMSMINFNHVLTRFTKRNNFISSHSPSSLH